MALSPAQTPDAATVFNAAVQRGLEPEKARDLVHAAFSTPDGSPVSFDHPGGAGDLLGLLGGKSAPIPTRSQDPRTQFALSIAQSIGSHRFDPAAINDALQTLHTSEQAQAHAPAPAPTAQAQPAARHVGDPFPAVESAAYAAPLASGAAGVIGKVSARYLGVPYRWGGTSAKTGLDCSGFLQNVYKDLGVNLPRTTYDQVKVGKPVDLHQLQPGDAIFTEPGHAGPNHVGMYVGNGMVQESPHTGDVNKLIPLDAFLSGGFVAARRYLSQSA